MFTPQTPAVQVPVATWDAALQSVRPAHVSPHALTWLRFVSQPGAAVQSPRPELHIATPQTPAVQVPVMTPGSALQSVRAPQVAPQVVGALRLTSQPLVALPSQLPKPASHVVMPHTPAEQVAAFTLLAPMQFTRPAHIVPHEVTELRLTSQPLAGLPSQFAKPGLQVVMPHPPAVHVAACTFGAALQSTRAPQVVPHEVTVLRLASQPFIALPSQLPKPVAQVETPHAPAVHVAVTTLGAEVQSTRAPHELPQDMGDVGATSQPLAGVESQSK